MKYLIFITATFMLTHTLFAQYKIAVVSGTTGQTNICPTLDSAYKKALPGDYIYLPAGTFELNTPIDKKINLIGAGINPDSTLLGITTIRNSLILISGSDSSYFEGIKVYTNGASSVVFGTDNVNSKVSGIKFMRCDIQVSFSNAILPEYRPTIISFYECVLGMGVNTVDEWEFIKCIFPGYVRSFTNSKFINNCFLYYTDFPNIYIGIAGTNSIFQNNIFSYLSNTLYPNATTNCTYYNNINASSAGSGNLIVNDVIVTSNQIFMDSNATHPISAGGELYKKNFHLKPESPGINAGTDGTDIGIYGTLQPTKAGWIPSNPHVYSQTIDSQNDANGNIRIRIKVKAQSN